MRAPAPPLRAGEGWGGVLCGHTEMLNRPLGRLFHGAGARQANAWNASSSGGRAMLPV